VTAQKTVVSAYCTRAAPFACLATRPVSMLKVWPPITFSTFLIIIVRFLSF
jgi:hypothetical protein